MQATTEAATTSKQLNEQDFPALESSFKNGNKGGLLSSALPAYQPSRITEVIEIPFEQRKYANEEDHFPGKRYGSQSKICMDIVKETGVEINLNTSKSNMLTVVLSGPPDKVAKAKRSIIAELQQQESAKITVPHEFHGYLIGRRGERLRELEMSTMTRINIPANNASDVITVSGPKQGIADALRTITEIVEKQSQLAFERIDIPKFYHPFICGPNNKYINDLRDRTETKIGVPPPGGPGTVFTISGKKESVAEALHEIQALYEEAKQTKAMTVRVKRSQHRLVFGTRGSGIAEILAESGVSVELPSDQSSEEIVLRGKPENLGRALSMVYERAERSVVEEISAPKRFYKLLIGKRGGALNELREGYEKVRIDFGDNEDKIVVEGPPEEVLVVVDRLKSRIAELETTVAMDTIKVDPKYFRHIIGRQGATIVRLREHRVQVRLPERGSNLDADEIVIEGDPAGVEKAKIEIRQLVKRLENEKCKDMIIEPSVQQLLCSAHNGAQPPIRTIYESFPKVSVVWPESAQPLDKADNPTRSVVQLRGDRQQVDAAAEKLQKLIKLVLEENHKQEIRIFKEFRPHIFGRGSAKIKKLLDETHTRIQYPDHTNNSDVFTIIGREENVQKAIQQLEALQKKMANVTEVIVSIPSALTTKFVGGQASSLRSIREQCDGVHIRFAQQQQQKSARKSNQVDVIILGPSEEVEKAQRLLEQFNAKVAQLCAEELVFVDPKFHGYLIGRQGATITRFRERHNVELLFPDRNETDPTLAKEIRIVGPKDAVSNAKAELEQLIKSIEDEIEQVVPVEMDLLKDVIQYRRTFSYPDLDLVRVIMPKLSTNRPDNSAQGTASNMVNIRLIGQKACVETATQVLQNMIADIRTQTTKEFALVDPMHFSVLDRIRSQFPELERAHGVFIRLARTPDSGTESAQPATADKATPKIGTLIITGNSDRIDFVYEDKIKPLLPIEEEFAIPQEFHRSLIFVPSTSERDRQRRVAAAPKRPKQSQSTEDEATSAETALSKAVQLRKRYGVFIRLPPQGSVGANHVYLRGTPDQIAAVRPELTEWLAYCEQLKADRVARAYEFSMHIPTRFVQSVLAMRAELTAKHDVGLRFGADVPAAAGATQTQHATATENADEREKSTATPTANEEEQEKPTTNGLSEHSEKEVEEQGEQKADEKQQSGDSATEFKEKMTVVIFRGYKERVDLAAEELRASVEKWMSYVTENLCIPAMVHSHLIGSRGSAVQKLMQEFNVRIEFPTRNARLQEGVDADTVFVTGEQENVDRACDYLIGKANDLMDRMEAESRNTRSLQFKEEILPIVHSNDTLKA